MQAVEQAKWGSYEKVALGIHSIQITTEEEKIGGESRGGPYH